MKNIIYAFGFLITLILLTSFGYQKKKINCPLTVEVSGLRNSKGVMQFTLYHTPDAFPDEDYKKYYRKHTAKVVDGFSTVTFENLPSGKYAVNILHDEDENGKLKSRVLYPQKQRFQVDGRVNPANYHPHVPGKVVPGKNTQLHAPDNGLLFNVSRKG